MYRSVLVSLRHWYQFVSSVYVLYLKKVNIEYPSPLQKDRKSQISCVGTIIVDRGPVNVLFKNTVLFVFMLSCIVSTLCIY